MTTTRFLRPWGLCFFASQGSSQRSTRHITATTNEDGEVECQIEDADGLVNMYGVELQDLAWHLLYYCPHCKMDTKGARVCGKCKDFRDEDDDGEGSDDENF